MNETDKVIIALGFFTLVGFISYLYFLRLSPATTVASQELISTSDLMKMRESRNRGVARW